MRATVDSNSRTALLSVLSEPQINIIARQLRLDFGERPFVLSDYDVVLASNYVSDDYYHHIPWGDSCITVASEYLVRMTNKAAWGAASDYHASWTTDGSTDSDWDQTDIANSSAGPVDPECYANTRIGLYPKAASDSVYVWYADTNGHICRVEWAVGTQTWSSITGTAYDIGDAEAIAIHPVSETEAFVVWVQDNGMYVQFLTWSGSWSADDAWLVWRSDDIYSMSAFYSDAELLSGTTHVLLLNLAQHGATYSLRYDSTTKILSQPIEAAGSNVDWTTQRAFATGLSAYNGRLWGVIQNALESSDETPQARHVSLISTEDGIHWRHEDFVGLNPCYGKLIYVAGATYCFVVGNAAVYKANATYKLGTDLAGMKRVIDEVGELNINCGGVNSPHSVAMSGINIDGDLIDDTKMKEGTEFEFQVREAGESYTTFIKTMLQKGDAQDAWGKAPVKMITRGVTSRLAGEDGWQHPTGRQYDSPAPYYTNFNFEDTGLARISAAQQSGIWMTRKDPRHGVYHLHGKRGHAVVPRKFYKPWLTLTSHFWFLNSVEVGGIIFFWEDEDNYWRAGFRRTPSTLAVQLVLEKVEDGVVTNLDTDDPISWTDLYPADEGRTKEISCYLDIKPSEVRAYFLVDDPSDDFSSEKIVTLTYDLTLEDDPVPFPFHVGYEMSEWLDMTGGVNTGTELLVTDSGSDWVELHYTETGYAGKKMYLEERWYTIKWVTGTRCYLYPTLRSEPAVGAEVGIYEEADYSQIVLRDIAVCDCSPAWTVDDLGTSLLEMAGVSRDVDTETVYNLADPSTAIYYGIDMKVTAAAPKLVIHASQPTNYSGWLVEVGASWCTLKKYDEGTPTTVAVYPNLIDLAAIASTEIRFIWHENVVYIYAGGHFLCSFWEVRTAGSGYSGPPDTVNATTTEFPQLIESFVLDAGRVITAALSSLLRGRPARMRENQDGSITLSRFDTHEDLGTWSSTVLATTDGLRGAPSLVETEGADVRQYYLEKEMARVALRYRKARNESAEGVIPTLRDAVRVARLARERSGYFETIMMTPDLAAECEDQVEVDSANYIIKSYTVTRSSGQGKRPKPRWRTKYTLREAYPAPTVGQWHTGGGSSKWGDAIQWG